MRRAAGEGGVIKTNDDAQATKLSCASLGYFRDTVLPLLHKSLPSRKPPLINRGTWARHAVFRQVTHDFITACTSHNISSSNSSHRAAAMGAAADTAVPDASADSGSSSRRGWEQQQQQPVCQVVALGAGTDSSWFSLQQQAWELLPAAHFIELDFQEVVSKKARTVLSTPQLLQLLPDGTTALTAPHVAAASLQPGPAMQQVAAAAGAMPPPMQQQQQQPSTGTAAAGQSPLPDLLGRNHASSSNSSHPHVAVTWTKQAQPAAAAAAVTGEGAASIPGQQMDAGSSSSALETQQQAAAPGSCKVQQQQQQQQLCGPLPPAAVVQHVQELAGQQYSLVAADLRDVQQLKAALARAGFKEGLPTLYLCECVLIYLEPAEAEAVLSTAAAAAAQAGAPAAVAIYEQTRPDDAFGATMIRNLEARGCPLRSVASVPTPASQAQRLQRNGWTAAAAADMAAVHAGGSNGGSSGSSRLPASVRPGSPGIAAAGASAAGGGGGADDDDVVGVCSRQQQEVNGWLRPRWQAERRRIEGLEMLDELEEWKLLQEHYCLAVGVLGDGPGSWLAEALQLQQLAALTS